jgi:hypothetical protein
MNLALLKNESKQPRKKGIAVPPPSSPLPTGRQVFSKGENTVSSLWPLARRAADPEGKGRRGGIFKTVKSYHRATIFPA